LESQIRANRVAVGTGPIRSRVWQRRRWSGATGVPARLRVRSRLADFAFRAGSGSGVGTRSGRSTTADGRLSLRGPPPPLRRLTALAEPPCIGSARFTWDAAMSDAGTSHPGLEQVQQGARPSSRSGWWTAPPSFSSRAVGCCALQWPRTRRCSWSCSPARTPAERTAHRSRSTSPRTGHQSRHASRR
jgi:hypothetical protein